jgi:hypothetical protein
MNFFIYWFWFGLENNKEQYKCNFLPKSDFDNVTILATCVLFFFFY